LNVDKVELICDERAFKAVSPSSCAICPIINRLGY
jgi:hypothetical protein